MEYRIQRWFEDEKRIIYRRLFNLQNSGGDLRYFEMLKNDLPMEDQKQFRSWPSVKKYLREVKNNEC